MSGARGVEARGTGLFGEEAALEVLDVGFLFGGEAAQDTAFRGEGEVDGFVEDLEVARDGLFVVEGVELGLGEAHVVEEGEIKVLRDGEIVPVVEVGGIFEEGAVGEVEFADDVGEELVDGLFFGLRRRFGGWQRWRGNFLFGVFLGHVDDWFLYFRRWLDLGRRGQAIFLHRYIVDRGRFLRLLLATDNGCLDNLPYGRTCCTLRSLFCLFGSLCFRLALFLLLILGELSLGRCTDSARRRRTRTRNRC